MEKIEKGGKLKSYQSLQFIKRTFKNLLREKMISQDSGVAKLSVHRAT
jgi:hypothetical protein